jgi:hypothetical protein
MIYIIIIDIYDSHHQNGQAEYLRDRTGCHPLVTTGKTGVATAAKGVMGNEFVEKIKL